MRNEKSLPKYFMHDIFKMLAFFISENKKTAPKMDKFFNVLTYIQRAAISESKS